MFNKNLADRAKQSWCMESGVNIIMIIDSTGTLRKIITEYVRLTVENIEANIQNFVGQQTSQSQNSVQLFHCITKSMTESAHLNIVAESKKYMYDETQFSELIFNLMMQKVIVNTRSTANHLRYNLINLDTYMYTVNFNIENFNQCANVNVDGLKARGERT